MLAAVPKLDDFRFHDCRHHFASWFVMGGGLLQALKELLGHADLKMTLRYTHLSLDHVRSEVEKTEEPSASCATAVEGIPPTSRTFSYPRVVFIVPPTQRSQHTRSSSSSGSVDR